MLDENLTKIVGRHQVAFGGRLTHNYSSNKPAGVADSLTYTKLSTALYDPTSGTGYNGATNTGAADASFFLGSASTYVMNLQALRMAYHQWLSSLYVQDNFHVTSRLTLNLGLRYEAHPALQTDNGLMNSFDLKNDAVVLAAPVAQLIAKGYTTQALKPSHASRKPEASGSSIPSFMAAMTQARMSPQRMVLTTARQFWMSS